MTDTGTKTDNPFWTFSLGIYVRDREVQQACLALQDDCGVDVNVMLYIMWLASRGQALTDGEVRSVVEMVEPWKAGVVVPLRTARRNLKSPPAEFEADACEALRTIVKKAELEAERLQQTALYEFRQVGDQAETETAWSAAAANLKAYGRVLGKELADAPVDVMLSALRALLDKS